MERVLEIVSIFSEDMPLSIKLSLVSSNLNTILYQVLQLNNISLTDVYNLRLFFKKFKTYKPIHRPRVNSWKRKLKNMDDPIILTL